MEFCVRLRTHGTRYLIAIQVSLIVVSTCIAAPFYSGVIDFEQPTGQKFTGVHQGDEFEEYYITSDGFTFLPMKGYGHGPYEYAILDSRGDLIPSGSLVAIDPPLPESYQLHRTGEALDEILQAANDFNQSLDDLPYWRTRTLEACSLDQQLVINVAILLIEFPDRPHVEEDVFQSIWAGQTRENIEKMMNSVGVYRGYQHEWPRDPGYNEDSHPILGQWAQGSFREYWQRASYGLWDVRL